MNIQEELKEYLALAKEGKLKEARAGLSVNARAYKSKYELHFNSNIVYIDEFMKSMNASMKSFGIPGFKMRREGDVKDYPIVSLSECSFEDVANLIERTIGHVEDKGNLKVTITGINKIIIGTSIE